MCSLSKCLLCKRSLKAVLVWGLLAVLVLVIILLHGTQKIFSNVASPIATGRLTETLPKGEVWGRGPQGSVNWHVADSVVERGHAVGTGDGAGNQKDAKNEDGVVRSPTKQRPADPNVGHKVGILSEQSLLTGTAGRGMIGRPAQPHGPDTYLSAAKRGGPNTEDGGRGTGGDADRLPDRLPDRGPGATPAQPKTLAGLPAASAASSQTRKKSLLIASVHRRRLSANARAIQVSLEYTRFFTAHPVITYASDLPALTLEVTESGGGWTDTEPGREQPLYSLIVFDSLFSYTSLDEDKRRVLNEFCAAHRVPMVVYATTAADLDVATDALDSDGVRMHLVPEQAELRQTADGPAARIIRSGRELTALRPEVWFTVPAGSTYVPLVMDAGRDARVASADGITSAVLLDGGHGEPAGGVRRAFIGAPASNWVTQMLFLDCLHYLSNGELSAPLDRFFMIDIDDIFLALPNQKIHEGDVKEMLTAQKRWSDNYISGFKLNLGFVGKYFGSGNAEDQKGDEALLRHSSEFNWFGHTFTHAKAHLKTAAGLRKQYKDNMGFAQTHNITVMPDYSVAPHHSGVFPVYEPLYSAWKEVWNISVTSTEEYPHFKGPQQRKGFIHGGLHVLPRQTCGLFTTTPFKEKLKGGMDGLNAEIRGGNLFMTVLYNQVNIYMTHTQNYGNDRLALHTFDELFEFLRLWTNLKLRYLPPKELASYYFSTYPDQQRPLWTNPCADKKQAEIWPTNKPCSLPQFIIVGPQKTGTTALHTFLSFHPNLFPSKKSVKDFEEVQFFNNDDNYMEGLEWYTNFFGNLSNIMPQEALLYEKSANYFDSPQAPKRAFTLLPQARIIMILIDPVLRAFSWYQHMRAHKDPVALRHSFYEVVTASAKRGASKNLLKLQKRAVLPGHYMTHIVSWLNYYDSDKVLIVDGDVLKNTPSQVLNGVQEFLHLESYIDYSRHMRFSKTKGFWCMVVPKKIKCLGPGKGRSSEYGRPDDRSWQHLTKVYSRSNSRLKLFLQQQGYPIPLWLQ